MNRKVTLKEIVGNQIVYAVIAAVYYWMWARSDWKDWYQTAQMALSWFLLAFFVIQASRVKKYKKEAVDEMAQQNLKRCDSICLKLFVTAMLAVTWVCAIFGHGNEMSTSLIGWAIILSILVLSIVRTVLFIIMDNRGV